jgi:hypothetical protein
MMAGPTVMMRMHMVMVGMGGTVVRWEVVVDMVVGMVVPMSVAVPRG